MSNPHRPALHRRDLLQLVVPAALASSAPGSDVPVLSPAHPEFYQLGVDDEIWVITYGEEQLSHDYRVGDDGNIAVPLLGPVRLRA